MVGVIDIGNHNVHLGLYRGERLYSSRTYQGSDRRWTQKVIAALRARSVSGCGIASVVPRMTRSIQDGIRTALGLKPVLVSHRTAGGLEFAYRKPATLGADRIANVVGGLARYRRNLIVIGCGTAVTFDVGLRSGHHAGGIIMPGMHAMFNALKTDTALLKGARYQRPRRLVGRSTEECMRAGAYYGSLYAIEGAAAALRKTLGRPCVCIVTGGWGRIVARHCPSIDRYDPSLTLYGILMVYYANAA